MDLTKYPELHHIMLPLEIICDTIALEINADCKISDWRIAATVIDIQFTIGIKYGRYQWREVVYLEPQSVMCPPETIRASAEIRYVDYEAVRVICPVYHPIPRDFWDGIADKLIAIYWAHNTARVRTDAMDTACEWDGLLMHQPDGTIEAGQWIGDDWWCAACLADLRAQVWMPCDWYDICDWYPALTEWLMNMS